ncbi:hypothetical protein DFR30_0606 [Thiogranum longum]|uniref:EF-hand domain-containing protein n=1 Tax=Thiogranum longum TaxID=1537524 RepID=A0A4R1H6J6_9GAMM|nr:hypothetical protein [Thiogranum longum]TCK17377.1 hypothetical protein DFR30_0606 [Thiogranum longum]
MKVLAGIVLSCIAAAHAYADTVVSVDERGLVAFIHLDSDHNGYVSRVEARSITGVERAFDTADSNRDGLLDKGEYTQVRQDR